jgi:hypothetical protein
MMVDPPELTDQESRNITLTALRQAAFDGQKTTLARIHYSHLARAADEIERLAADKKNLARGLVENVDVQRELGAEIERLAAELANANRLLEIGRRRSLEKSGGLEIGNND